MYELEGELPEIPNLDFDDDNIDDGFVGLGMEL